MLRSTAQRVVMAVGVLSVVAVFAPPAAASQTASQGALSCVSSADEHFRPGLQLQPRTVLIRIDGVLDPCVDTSGQSITAGSYGAHLHAVRSCADLLAPADGVFEVVWNGGVHGFSRISFQRTATIVGGTIITTETGTVVAGDFLGHSTLFETVGPHNPLDCTTTAGVRLVHTNGNLTISPL